MYIDEIKDPLTLFAHPAGYKMFYQQGVEQIIYAGAISVTSFFPGNSTGSLTAFESGDDVFGEEV